MDHIQPRFDLLQLVGGIAQVIPGVPNLLGNILHLVHQVRHPVMHGAEAVAEPSQPGQCILRLGQKSRGAVGVVAAVKAFHCLVHAVAELLGILQELSPLLQGLVLPRLQIGLLYLGDLVFQGFHAAKLFSFVHGQGIDFPAKFRNRDIFLPIVLAKGFIVRKGVQKSQVVILVEQGRGIVLPVNVNQLDAKLMQNGHGNQASIDTADIFPVQKYLPLNYRFRVILHAVIRKPAQLRYTRKDRPNGGFGSACANHIPVCTLAQNCRDGINDNGFTGACLACQDVKAPVEGNIRALNDRDILDMQKTQHGASLLNQFRSPLISPQKAAAALVSRMTINTVSSPARVPSTTLMFIASTAEAAALARPGSVWITMMFCA